MARGLSGRAKLAEAFPSPAAESRPLRWNAHEAALTQEAEGTSTRPTLIGWRSFYGGPLAPPRQPLGDGGSFSSRAVLIAFVHALVELGSSDAAAVQRLAGDLDAGVRHAAETAVAKAAE